MRRRILLVLAFAFSLFMFSSTLNANPEELVSVNNGASIRTKTETSEQGIRFTAKLNEQAKDKEHGFYLVYGETTVDELVVAINNGGSPMIINDKEVFKVTVPGVTSENEYSVVLTGTPEHGYLDGLTAIPYVKDGDVYHFSKAPLTRSIAEVAMNLKNADQPHQAYDAIIDCVSDVKRLVPDNEGNLRLTSGIIETNPLNLKKEFARDWNQKFGTNLNDFNAAEFYQEARKPLTPADEETNKNISETNLFKFFSEAPQNNKWKWLIEVLEEVCVENAVLISQLDAFKYGGVHPQGHDLKNGKNLSYSIANFFNCANEGATENIDFTNENNYQCVPIRNKSVIINPRNYRGLYRGNEEIGVPMPSEAPRGYRFRHYEVDGAIVNPGDFYRPTKDDVVFRPQYEAINYNIRFYDGATEIGAFKATYNIEVELIFAVPDKPGYLFLGWYDNAELVGEPLTRLTQGNQGHLSFYASWEKEDVGEPVNPNEEFTITFELNNGVWPVTSGTPGYTDRDEMIKDFLTDFYNFAKPAGVSLNDFMHGTGKTSGYDGLYNATDTFEMLYSANVKGVDASTGKFINQSEYNKWVPLLDVMEEFTQLGEQSFWGSPYTGERRIKPFIQGVKPAGAWNHIPIEDVTAISNKIPEALKGSTPGVTIDIPKNYTPSSNDIILPNPEKTGDNFLGWYDNAHFGGVAITKIEKGSSGNLKFYARWESMIIVDPDPDLQEYTVTFDTKGGNAISSINVVEGNKVTKPANPTKEGYVFVEWQLSGLAFDFNTEVRSNLTLVAVYRIEEVVDPGQEYTITFNLNGGAWEKTGAQEGYSNRDVMITDFLKDFHKFLKLSISVNDFIHGTGKTSGFDGSYADHVADLRALNDKTVNPGTAKFVNQAEYNKWVPIVDLMDQYTGFNPDQVGQFWGSDWTAGVRFKPFVQKKNLFGAAVEDEVMAVVNNIPTALKGGTSGTPITPPSKYKSTDEIILPKPEKANDPFIGWYDNSDYQGNPISKILKGSTGNKVFYARYNSTEVALTPTEKMTLAKAALQVGFASGDSASSVTKKVTLPTTGLHGATVTWATSDDSTINTAGNVVLKDKDVKVTLTATIKVGSLTETKVFTVTVKQFVPEPEFYTIEFVLNGGKFVIKGYTDKATLAKDILTDLYAFVKPTENLTTFMHGAGKTSGFDGTWYSNEEYRAKIFTAGVKSGNNSYFLSHSSYQAKWKPFADFMVTFVKAGNPDQDFWSSPFTGNLRMKQYFTNVKPGAAWSDEDMAKIPTGLAATVIPSKYDKDTATITLLTPEKAGYDFVGWYTANTGGTKVTSIPKGSTGNKTFYARWEEVSAFTITYHLNSGKFAGYTSKATLARDFLTDLHSFVGASENVTTFMHGAGKTSGFDGTWYSNEEHRGKIYAANVKSGNNAYFLSSSSYQAKWKPFADFMVTFVKVGNPDQDFWSSPFTGNLRMKQYFTDVKPGGAWSDADMAKIPTGLAANVYYEYNVNSPAITLPTPTRSGHDFLGWYTANTGGTKVTSIPKGSTGNKVFYARWKEVSNPELIALMNLLTGGHKSTLNKKSILYYGATNYSKTQYELVNRYLFNEPLSINKTSYWLPTSKINHPNTTHTKHWVVLHDTANTNAGAAANANFMMNTTAYVSWHYTVGNDGIYQSMAENMKAYHAGDGSSYSVFHNTGISASNPYTRPRLGLSGGYFTINGTRTNVKAPTGTTTANFRERGIWPVIINGKYHINDTSLRTGQRYGASLGLDGGNVNGIGIETSVLRTDHIWYTWAKTSKLVADILVRRGLLPDRIVYHNNFDGKQCPKTALLNGLLDEWEQMMFLEYKIRKDYSNYKIDFTSHSSILDNKGRVTALQSSTRNVTYTIKLTAPNGVTMSKTFTTSVRA